MEENPLKIRIAEQTVAARAAGRRHSGGSWLTAGVILLLLLLAGGIFLAWPRPIERPTSVLPDRVQPTNQTKLAADTDAQLADPTQQELVADDGESLWISPTAGQPIERGYLLPGTQLILHIRVADLLEHAEGNKIFAALGLWGEQVAQQLASSTGAELREMETLLVGIRATRSGSLDYTLRIRLSQPWLEKELANRLPNGHAAAGRDQAYYVQNERACFLPSQLGGKVLVSCPAEALPELDPTGGTLFARELARVLQRTDATRMATLVFAGKFLQISGEKFLSGTGAPLRAALVDFLGDEATATLLSAHWDENFFLELQSTVALNQRPHRFAGLLQKRATASSDRIEDALLTEPPHLYGRKVLARFPAMLRKLGNYTRSGEEEGFSVLRSYLPVTAGHNLLMATELFLNSPASQGVSARDVIAVESSPEPQSVDQRLEQTISLVFPKETLQRAVEMLSEDLGVPIEIAGRDLQLEGISKNQSFDLDLRDRPASDILLAVLARANPDRTASGPGDPKQKLVYVIRDKIGHRPCAIVVTTRAAAGRRGEKLPAIFDTAPR